MQTFIYHGKSITPPSNEDTQLQASSNGLAHADRKEGIRESVHTNICNERDTVSRKRTFVSVQNGSIAREYEDLKDPSTLLYLIKTCAKQKDLNQGRRIHADIIRQGLLERDVSFGNSLLSMYAKCGTFAKMCELFDQIPERDVVSWNALISALTRHGHSNEAFSCMEGMRDEGLEPDLITYMCLLKVCGSRKEVERGEILHADLCKQGLLETDVALETALIDMYMKCSEITRARTVFNKLSSPDVVAWNVLIAGYAQHGLNDDSLRCFDQMLDKGFPPNAVTFVCILKACGNAGEVEKGEEIHVEIDRHRLVETNIVVGTALVDMYSKCGNLSKALHVFDQLPSRNVISWNALLTGCVQHGYGCEALKFFEQMRGEGTSPDEVTFLNILKACASMHAVQKGEEIHAEISAQGLLEKESFLGTALVAMYSKFGAPDKAQEIFDNLPSWDVASWTALISGYVEHERGAEALRCLKKMQDGGFAPDRVTYLCILKACGSIGAVKKGEKIHAEVNRQRLLENDVALGTAVVDMYAKCGALSKAQAVFDKLPLQNPITWNSLIAGYVQHSFYDEALCCFKQMRAKGVFPDMASVVSILQACGRKRTYEIGEEILREIGWQHLWKEDWVLGNAVVSMYAKSGALAKAQAIFDNLSRCEGVTWNVLIAGYSEHGYDEEALKCFQKMTEGGVAPDAVTFTHILRSCGNMGKFEIGAAIHGEVKRQGLVINDNVLGTSLLDMYAKCGKLVAAQNVFDMLQSRDVVTWNALISGYTEYSHGNEVIRCFEQMKEAGVSPDSGTYACILKACGCMVAIKKGEEIHAEIKSLGLLETDMLLGTALVDMYAKCGMIAKSQAVFDELPSKDVVTWNALISGFVQQGRADEAISCFKAICEEEVNTPNAITFACILKACGMIGALGIGKEIHTEIGKQGLLERDKLSFVGTALVDMYSKCGAGTQAAELFNELPTRTLATWNALMAGYAQVGKIRMAFNLFKNMLQECLIPDKVTFIILLNGYSHAGLLEEGLSCFRTMASLYSIDPDLEHFTWVIDNLSRAGTFDSALSVLQEVGSSEFFPLCLVLMGACQRDGAMDVGTWIFNNLILLDIEISPSFVSTSHLCADMSVHAD